MAKKKQTNKQRKLQKRKQAQQRRVDLKKAKTTLEGTGYFEIDNKGKLNFSNNYLKQDNSSDKDWLQFYQDEYNKMYSKYNKKEKKELLNLIKKHSKSLDIIKKNKENRQKGINIISSDDLIISNRLNGAVNLHNTKKIDTIVKDIADILNISFDETLNYIFPSFEEVSFYETKLQLKADAEKDFSSMVKEKLDNEEITEQQYNTVVQLQYQATHQ